MANINYRDSMAKFWIMMHHSFYRAIRFSLSILALTQLGRASLTTKTDGTRLSPLRELLHVITFCLVFCWQENTVWPSCHSWALTKRASLIALQHFHHHRTTSRNPLVSCLFRQFLKNIAATINLWRNVCFGVSFLVIAAELKSLSKTRTGQFRGQIGLATVTYSHGGYF